MMLLATGCGGGGSGDGDDDDDGIDAAATVDAAPVVPCRGSTMFTLQESAPELASVNTPAASETSARLSADGLTMYLIIGAALHVSTRATTGDAFSAPVPVTIPGLDGDNVGSPSLTAAGDALYFTRLVGDGIGAPFSIWRAPRSPDGTLGTPVQLTELVDPQRPDASLIGAYILPDESAIYYAKERDIYRAARSASGSFEAPVWLEEIEPWPMKAQTALVTPDELLMVVGAKTSSDTSLVHVYTRTDNTQPWGTPVEQPGFTWHIPGWVSPDGCRLYTFGRFDQALRDIHVATRAP
jgi:hypothetical protein